MRVLIVDTMYPGFLAEHYRRHPELGKQSYDVQWRALMDRAFGTADSYSHNLHALGHTGHELVINCPPLQHRWAKEHRVQRWPWRHEFDLVVDQAADFEPDVIYVQDLWALPDPVLDQLRSRYFVAGQIASEAPPLERLKRFDLILTSFPHFVERFRSMGIDSEYLRIGFDPRVFDRLPMDKATEGAVFVGSLGRSQHDRGNAILEQAARSVPIDFWGRGSEEWPPDSPIRQRFRGEAWGLAMLEVLSRARIALNRHIDVADGYANNMRLYEATGAGALLITDEGRNLAELFVPGSEIVTYHDAKDLADRIAYYLDHEDERSAIAQAGQARTLRDHTYANRIRELAEILERYKGRATS